MFFLDFWKINQNISKIFPLLKIFGNKNGIFRGNPENLSKRWVFFLSFTNLSKVDPRGWVFSLSFLLEFCPWVLVFSAVDVKKKACTTGSFSFEGKKLEVFLAIEFFSKMSRKNALMDVLYISHEIDHCLNWHGSDLQTIDCLIDFWKYVFHEGPKISNKGHK